MKKIMLFVGLMLGLVVLKAYAGTNWSTATGGSWTTPDDSTATVGMPIVIGAAGGPVAVVNQVGVTLLSRTSTQLLALTPNTTGQIAFCNNCTNTFVVVSTGVGAGAWVGVLRSTFTSGALIPQ